MPTTINKPFQLEQPRQQYLDWQNKNIDRGLTDVRREVAREAELSGVGGSPYGAGLYRPYLEQAQNMKAGAAAEVGREQLTRDEARRDTGAARAFEGSLASRGEAISREQMDVQRHQIDTQYNQFLEELNFRKAELEAKARAAKAGSRAGMWGAIIGSVLPKIPFSEIGSGIYNLFSGGSSSAPWSSTATPPGPGPRENTNGLRLEDSMPQTDLLSKYR